MTKPKRFLAYLIVTVAFTGVLDALYLTYEHYSGIVPPCSIHWWLADCGKVLQSPYSLLFGLVPLALLGVFQYAAELCLAILSIANPNRLFQLLLIALSTIGVLFSSYFVYLIFGVIHATCLYCLGSAVISFLIFVTTLVTYSPRIRTKKV